MSTLNRNLILFLATGGWIGFSPVAPGTFGSLAAVPLCLLLSLMPLRFAALSLAALTVVSIWIAHHGEHVVGSKDPKQVVIDEICGMAVTMFALPFTPASVIGGFALFRVFDIVKPFPIRWVDKRVTGGLGVVLDDVLAGLIANLLLRASMGMFAVG